MKVPNHLRSPEAQQVVFRSGCDLEQNLRYHANIQPACLVLAGRLGLLPAGCRLALWPGVWFERSCIFVR